MKSSSTTSTSRMSSLPRTATVRPAAAPRTARRRTGASLTSTVPPCCAVTSRTSARPMPRPPGTSGFEVTPRAKIDSRRCSGTPGPESATEIVRPSSVVDAARSTVAGSAAHRNVDRVVDQVAQQGDHVGRQRGVQRRQVRVRRDLQRHPALRGQRRLRDQQRRDRRIGDSLRHRVADLGAPPRQGADQVAHRVVLTELHQARDGVQLVGELVGLRAQRVGHALVRRQLALQRTPVRCCRAWSSPCRSAGPGWWPPAGSTPKPVCGWRSRRRGRPRRRAGIRRPRDRGRRCRRGDRPRQPSTSSSSCALSLSRVMSPSLFTATTPSRMLCSNASR